MSMADVAVLAQGLIAILRPFLKGLLREGEYKIEDAGQQTADMTWSFANRIWKRLFPRLRQNPAAQEALQDAAAMPEDRRATGALELQIEKLLRADESLAQEFSRIVDEARQSFTLIGRDVIQVHGDRGSVVAGGDMHVGGDIQTGDTYA